MEGCDTEVISYPYPKVRKRRFFLGNELAKGHYARKGLRSA
jgi:hypothetical protein